MEVSSSNKEDFIQQVMEMEPPREDKIEITRISFHGEGEVWYKIPSGFPGMTILVEESAIEGVSAKLVREDGTTSVAGE